MQVPSIEELNSLWLREFKKLAWRSSSPPPEGGYLFSLKSDDCGGYDMAGKMFLPSGSRRMVDKMAFFCRCDMSKEPSPSGIKFFPPTYWAHSLLYAAYPKHGDMFKGHDGASHVLCLSSPEGLSDDELECCRFQGLGVILMESVRSIMCPVDDDDTLLSKSKEWYISIEG
jgi:hypothetical protein